MARTRKHPPLATHNAVLGPTLARHADNPSAFRVALAVTCRGLDADIAPQAIRLWLRSRGGDRFASVTSTPRSFQPVLARARAKVASVSSSSARRGEAVAVARRLVGSLLTEVPASAKVSAHRQALARHALAVVGVALLDSIREKGWDTVMVSGPWLAVQMGVEERTARAALRTCVELRWLRVVQKRKGSAWRYDMPRLSAARGETADNFTFAVDALVENDPTLDPVAEMIALASHPAFGYGLGSKTWLVALADAAELDAARFGVGKRMVPVLRRDWLAALVTHTPDAEGDTTLPEVLDSYAETTGAKGRWSVAETARREAAEARRLDTVAARERKTKVHTALDRLLTVHRLPKPDARVEHLQAWVRKMAETIAANGLPDEVRPLLAKALAGRMTRAGYEPEAAARVAEYITAGSVTAA